MFFSFLFERKKTKSNDHERNINLTSKPMRMKVEKYDISGIKAEICPVKKMSRRGGRRDLLTH